MTFDYARIAATSLRLLEHYGRAAYLRRTSSEYNPSTGTTTQQTVNHEATCAFFDYAQRDIDGTLIRTGDQRVLMAPTVPRPETGDAIVIGASTYSVVQVRAINPAGVPVLYELQCRGVA